MTVGDYARLLASCLNALEVPEPLKAGVEYGPAFPDGLAPWPPKPGCGQSPDLAVVRMWARLDLAKWIEQAPNAFGPHLNGELDRLAAVGARLRVAGEGALVLWGIDAVPAAQWVDHPSTGLAVAELVCCGPRLADDLVNEVDTELTAIGWWYSAEQANRSCIINRTPCYETAWHEANTRSAAFSPCVAPNDRPAGRSG